MKQSAIKFYETTLSSPFLNAFKDGFVVFIVEFGGVVGVWNTHCALLL